MTLRSAPSRFWDKVTKTDTCWLWIGSVTNQYGQIMVHGKIRKTHTILVGDAPSGYIWHHKCEVKICVNPDHLELLTYSDHKRYHLGWKKIDGKWFCSRGHEINHSNSLKNRNTIQCRQCLNESRHKNERLPSESKRRP